MKVKLMWAMAGLLAASSCGSGAAEVRGPAAPATTPAPAATTPVPSSSGPSPQAVLAKAGLELPTGASDVSVEQQDRPPYRESYLLRLRLPVDAARSWCDTGGLGGAGVIAGLTTQDKTFLGQSSAATGSLLCTASWPQDVSWQRIVLIEPEDGASSGTAPTRVTAAIYQMPVH